jgi:hypothetical protein
VRHYGTGEVIKLPRLGQLFGVDTLARMRRDREVGKEFFGNYMLDTRVVISSDHKRSALVQPFVRGRFLRKEDLTGPAIAKQFRDIAARHENLMSAGYVGVDLMSGFGFLSGTLRNVFLLEDGSVSVIDVMLVDMLYKPLCRFVMWRQEKIMRRYLS